MSIREWKIKGGSGEGSTRIGEGARDEGERLGLGLAEGSRYVVYGN